MTWIDWEQESSLVFDLKAGLEAALQEEDLDLEEIQNQEIPGFNDGNIKANKLAHRAIDQYNLPILSTWYKYGQYEPHEEFTPQAISPRSLDRHGFPSEPSVPSRDYPSAEDFKHFFLECELEKIVEQDMYEFLEENYTEFAGKYEEIYLANLSILRIFDEIVINGNFVENASYYNAQMTKYSTRMRQELISDPIFDQSAEDIVVSFLRTVRNALTAVAEKKETNHNLVQFFEKARKWYHMFIWAVPALQISIEESEGVRQQEFKEKGQQKLSQLRQTAIEKNDDLLDKLFDKNLSPSVDGYREIEEQISPELRQLARSGL